MNKSVRRTSVWAIAGVIAASAATASADSITATLDSVSPARIVGVNYNGSYLGQAYAGALNWHGVAANGYDLAGTFSTFCIDLTQDVFVGSSYTFTTAGIQDAPNPLPPTAPIGATGMGLTSAQFIEKLYAQQYDNIGTDHDRGAAFQLAIWEILFDTNPSRDLAGGMFSVTGTSAAVMNLANQYVADATTPGVMTFHHQIMALTSATAQDQLFLGGVNGFEETGPTPPLVAVPTPAAAFGALPLLGGLAVARRRRLRD